MNAHAFLPAAALLLLVAILAMLGSNISHAADPKDCEGKKKTSTYYGGVGVLVSS